MGLRTSVEECSLTRGFMSRSRTTGCLLHRLQLLDPIPQRVLLPSVFTDGLGISRCLLTRWESVHPVPPGKAGRREIWDFPASEKGHSPSESTATRSPEGQAWKPKDGVAQCLKSPLWDLWDFRNVSSLPQGVDSGEMA